MGYQEVKVGLLIKRFVITGGAERVVVELARYLLSKGHTVHLYAQAWDPSLSVMEGLILHRLPSVRKPRWLNSLILALGANRCAQREQLDLLHAHERTFRYDLLTVHGICHKNWIWRRRSPLRKGVNWIRAAVNPRHVGYLFLESRQFHHSAGQIVAVSRLIREDILANYRARAPINVVSPGVDSVTFSPSMRRQLREEARRRFSFSPEETVLVFVGSEFRRKGLQHLFAALASDPSLTRRVKVLVVGGGPVRAYQTLAGRLGIADSVCFTGLVPDLRFCYASADIFCLPSLREPFGLAVLEAMACGLPVLICRESGGAELVQDGVDALLLSDPADAEEFLQAIRMLLDPQRREEMGRAARETACRFSWEVMGEAYEKLYMELKETWE